MWEDDADFNVAFKGVARIHNEQCNPTGVPWKPKRLADIELDQSVDSRAQVLQAASTTKDQLAAKGDLACVLGTEPNYELLVCTDGHLWVHALNDGILSDQVPLCGCGNYQYVLGAEADQVSQGQGAPRQLVDQNDRCTLSLCQFRVVFAAMGKVIGTHSPFWTTSGRLSLSWRVHVPSPRSSSQRPPH